MRKLNEFFFFHFNEILSNRQYVSNLISKYYVPICCFNVYIIMDEILEIFNVTLYGFLLFIIIIKIDSYFFIKIRPFFVIKNSVMKLKLKFC